MTSVAQRKRARRASRSMAPAAPRSSPSLVVDNAPAAPVRESGLDWLLSRKRITRQQFNAGQRWGADFRLSLTDGMEPLRSCLNDSPRGCGEGAHGRSFAAVETEARDRRFRASSALFWQVEMIEALDAVCGRQLTPWERIREVGGRQRQVEELQTTLRLALDILDKHYRLTNI